MILFVVVVGLVSVVVIAVTEVFAVVVFVTLMAVVVAVVVQKLQNEVLDKMYFLSQRSNQWPIL